MHDQLTVTQVGFVFLCFSIIAFTAYMRILMYLNALDAGLENPPERPHMGEKLQAYKAFCAERGRRPVLLYIFAVGAIGAVIFWLPLPWLLLR
ncbi:hypothetical protein JW823_00335 [bacterium]|nr:hypothetical protein [candidate division CSSED10-310 bacterium]